MELFLEIILGMPTGIYTVLLGFMSVYWFFTILGVVDIDFLDVDGAVEGLEGSIDGAADGILDGADGLLDGADGALEGLDGVLDGADGILEGADGAAEGLDGALEGADGALEGADGALEGADGVELDGGGGGSLFLNILNFFNLRAVPLTVSLSILVLFSWAVCYIGSRFLLDLIPIPIVGETIVFFGSTLIGAFIASGTLRPFEGKFVTQKAKKIEAYLGSSCTIVSPRVDSSFGEAKIPNPNGAPLLMQVRCDHENELKRGEEALVVSRDIKRKVLIVEPME